MSSSYISGRYRVKA